MKFGKMLIYFGLTSTLIVEASFFSSMQANAKLLGLEANFQTSNATVSSGKTTYQPILISVSTNWTSKLPSARNNIINAINKQLTPLARGNQGYAQVEALRVEGRNLFVKVLIHHKHRPSGLGVPYSAKTWVETRYNPLDKSSLEDKTNLCVEGPKIIRSLKMCATAGDIRRTISAFL